MFVLRVSATDHRLTPVLCVLEHLPLARPSIGASARLTALSKAAQFENQRTTHQRATTLHPQKTIPADSIPAKNHAGRHSATMPDLHHPTNHRGAHKGHPVVEQLVQVAGNLRSGCGEVRGFANVLGKIEELERRLPTLLQQFPIPAAHGAIDSITPIQRLVGLTGLLASQIGK